MFERKEIFILGTLILIGSNYAKNVPDVSSAFKLVILHVNDIHAHIEKTSEDLTR